MLILKKSTLSFWLRLTWLMATLFVLHYGFIKLPFEYVTQVQPIWFLLSCVVLVPLYARHMVAAVVRTRYLHYVFLLMVFPFVYGVVGSIHLEQTVEQGIAAGRIFFWPFMLVIMVTFINLKQTTVMQIIAALKNLAWFCLLAYIVIILFADLTKSRTYDNTELRGERLRFDATFIVYGFMYYYLRALTARKYLRNYLLSLPFLAFLMFYLQSRSVLSALILAAIIVPLFCLKSSAKVKFLFVACIAATLLILTILINPDFKLALLFKYLIEFITEGNTADISADYRGYEAVIALQSIAERPWFGVGLISYQLNTILEILGRVNVADVGILGIIMEYGYVGTIILMLPFVSVWKKLFLYRQEKNIKTDPYICQLLLLMNIYMFFMCIFTGMMAYAPLSVMFFTCLLFLQSESSAGQLRS